MQPRVHMGHLIFCTRCVRPRFWHNRHKCRDGSKLDVGGIGACRALAEHRERFYSFRPTLLE